MASRTGILIACCANFGSGTVRLWRLGQLQTGVVRGQTGKLLFTEAQGNRTHALPRLILLSVTPPAGFEIQ
ncbi:hypothetical protein D3C85_1862870 [compost metagenome]